MTITADRIKQSRESKEWTKGRLAKEMGVSSQTTITNWENGSVTPNETKLKELSRILEVDYLYLLGVQDIPKTLTEGDRDDLSLIDVLKDDELSVMLNPFPGTGSYENKPFAHIYKAYRDNPEKRHLLIEIADLINQHKE